MMAGEETAMGARPDIASLEAVEQSAWWDMFAAAPPALAAATGLSQARFGDIAAFGLKAAPSIEFNYAPGASLSAGARGIEALAGWMRAHCAAVFAIQSIGDRANDALAAQGLSPTNSWTKFIRSTDAPPVAETGLRIEVVGAGRAADFGAAAQQGFGAPPPFAGWLAAIPGRPGWTCYVAYDGETPAAAAALHVADGLAWAGVGACVPAFRKRGAQSALLACRIADARELGLNWIVTETGTPPPGGEADHPSWRNIRRAGFEAVYERVNWRP